MGITLYKYDTDKQDYERNTFIDLRGTMNEQQRLAVADLLQSYLRNGIYINTFIDILESKITSDIVAIDLYSHFVTTLDELVFNVIFIDKFGITSEPISIKIFLDDHMTLIFALHFMSFVLLDKEINYYYTDKGKLFEMIEEMEEHYTIGQTKYKKQTYTR